MKRAWMTAVGVAAAFVVLPSALPVATASSPSPPFIAPDADWLTTVNYFRAMSGLGPVNEDPSLSTGAVKHSCYMLLNDITHYEESSKPGYTVDGARAGRNGNVAVSSVFNTLDRSHIELWMTGPFHAIGILRRDLQRVGYGACNNANTPRWRSGATLDVLSGLGSRTPYPGAITFPGNGSTTSLSKFITETPNPLDFCGWTGTPAGLPVFAMMPEAVTGSVSTTLTGPSGPVETCTLSPLNTNGAAQQILAFDNVVVAVPRVQLQPGTYTATARTAARTVSWTFTVDPQAAIGPVQEPAPVASPSASPAGFQSIEPVRVVDTRINLGATSLRANQAKRIQIGGRASIPGGVSAVSANFTVAEPAGGGFVTLWNCSSTQPIVSTLNFAQGDVVPNAATIPLDANGGLCAFSSVDAQLLIDVNGYYGSSGASRFTPLTPTRIADTRNGQGAPQLRNGQTLVIPVAGVAGVPSGAEAVALNVTSTQATEGGYVTAWACDDQQPSASNLNPKPGRSRPNLVVIPVAADGTICLYTSGAVDLIVDVTGYYSATAFGRFTPTIPFRFVDTRDRYRPEVNIGLGGRRLAAGQTIQVQIAGIRNVPSDAKAVSINITVTGALGTGYLTAWPCDVARPVASSANYTAGEDVGNAAQLPLSAGGLLCVYSEADAHVILDVNGWWS
jgi:hypothetical protein